MTPAVNTTPQRRERRTPIRGIKGGHPICLDALDLTHEDRGILEAAQRWAPYGGTPADEIWVNFGMSVPQFSREVERILGLRALRAFAPAIREQLSMVVNPATTKPARSSRSSRRR